MHEEQKQLFKEFPERYPRVFEQGDTFGGFAVSYGWAKLLDTLFARLETILQAAPKETKLQIQQIKEKFGTLRFYYDLDNADEAVEKAIEQAVDLAEEASGQVCEECGEPGETAGGGYILTLCPACRMGREVKFGEGRG